MTELKALGSATVYKYDKPDASLLESFDVPPRVFESTLSLHIEVPEFTSLCPMNGQPDFATIVIDYIPYKKCVESKALKLYLMSYRMHGAFHEACVSRISDDLIALLDPRHLRVQGQFTPRGGISFGPIVVYTQGLVQYRAKE